MKKKYRLTNTKVVYKGKTLYRIIALKDFGDVKKGERGGWIESEDNLSHDGDCWVGDDAYVYGEARIFGNAQVYDKAEVFGNAKIWDNTEVYETSQVYDDAEIIGDARVYGDAILRGKTIIRDGVEVCGNAVIDIDATFWGYAFIESNSDFEVFRDNWGTGGYFVYTKTDKKWSVGYFNGTGKELIERAYEVSKLNGKMYEKYVRFVEPESWVIRLKNFITKSGRL